MAKYYYCIANSSTSISSSVISSSTALEFTETTRTIHFNCDNQYAYFVVDKSLGEFSFQVNIFKGGFEDPTEITVNDVVYRSYRSTQKLKGSIDIELINVNVATEYLGTQWELRPKTDFALVQAEYIGYNGQRMDRIIRDWQTVYNSIEAITEQNSRSITANTASITANTTAIAANTAKINTNTANIATNTSDINALKSKVETLEGGIKLKGRVDSVSLLPATAEIGDLYLVGLTTDTDLAEYLYTSAGHWELLGKVGDIDLSEYAKKTDIPKDYIRNGSQTSTSTADGGTNIYTFTYADGTTSTFTVKNGTKGSTGAQGPQGIQGIQGEKGEKGDTGPKGETGATGPEGPKGATGSTGPQGPKGDTGAAGSNGTSCTHSWNGTTLTVTSASGTSSANLKGEKGDKGDTGSTGPKGDTGPQGPAGQNATTTAVATTSANGLMSKDHVTKLNGIATGATAVSEITVSGWGFTKNSGTYSKPSTGIPKTDLASAVQTSLGLADTALQSYTEKYTGTYSKPSGGIPKTDLASAVQTSLGKADTALQSHQSLDGCVKNPVDITNQTVDLNTYYNGNGDNTYRLYICKTTGGSNNISNKPQSGAFLLEVFPSRSNGTTDSVTEQICHTFDKKTFQRFYYINAWTSWVEMKFTDTTYSNKSAASGGTDVSLVTTGEKYTWNSKTSNTGTVTSVAVKMNGSTKGTVTSSGTIDLGTVITSHQDISGKQDKLTAGSNITISGSTISAKDTTYSVATTSANGLMSSTDKSKLDGIAAGANNYSLPQRLAEKITASENPDTIETNGFHYVSSDANSPFKQFHSNNLEYMIISQFYNSSWGCQIALDFRTNYIAVRNKDNGTWKSWTLMCKYNDSRLKNDVGRNLVGNLANKCPCTINGVTFNYNYKTGIISLSGTATADASLSIIASGTTMPATVNITANSSHDNVYLRFYTSSWGNPTSATKSNTVAYSNLGIMNLIVKSGTNTSGVTVKPFIVDYYNPIQTYCAYVPTNEELFEMIMK